MDHERDLCIHFATCTYSGTYKTCNIVIIRNLSFRPEQTIGKLVSNLDHCYTNTRSNHFLQRLQCKIIYRLLQFFYSIILPCLWLDLFSRICPEITVMEVQKHTKSGFCYTFSNCDRFLKIIISGSIRFSSLRFRVIP